MRKISAAGVLFCVLFSYFLPFTEALSLRGSQVEEGGYTPIEYPSGESFDRLKGIIDSTFTIKSKKSYGACLSSGWLCPNYKYTSLSEKAIKYIILDTYAGNEDFYKTLFSSYSYSNYDNLNTNGGVKRDITEILRQVPKGSLVLGGVTSIFPTSRGDIASELMESSFGLDFTANTSSNSMLGAIEQKIKDLKREKCSKVNGYDSVKCPYSGQISNGYLPTEEELYKETIYLNRGAVKIESLKDEFEYKINSTKQENKEVAVPYYGSGSNKVEIYCDFESPACISFNEKVFPTFKKQADLGNAIIIYHQFPLKFHKNAYYDALAVMCANEKGKYEEYSKFLFEKEGQLGGTPFSNSERIEGAVNIGITENDFRVCLEDEKYGDYIKSELSLGESIGVYGIPSVFLNGKKLDNKVFLDVDQLGTFLTEPSNIESIRELPPVITLISGEKNYTLRYKKDAFTLEEAKDAIEKGDIAGAGGYVYNNNSGFSNSLPCLSNGNQLTRSQCTMASTNLNVVVTALGAYYADREIYPESIDSLGKNYIYKEGVLEDFKKNFEYRSLTGSSPDFEIKYIGNIGAGTSIATADKKDYVALMSGATVPEIPAIFSHVPRNSMVLYVKNPQDLFELLSIKSNTTTRISGIDVSDTVKKTLQDFFELKDFSTLEKNLKHELALVIDNLDMTTPDITMILSESDREALSPTAKARVVGSKDGFIYIASSKANIDRMMNLEKKNSLTDAPDFRYVWWKKSALIRDAFFFVGDEFFEKMLSFETYITHYRKLHDVEKLSQLQELAWAYEDAYGKKPENLDDLIKKFQDLKITKDDLAAYTIADGIISDSRIGSIKSLKTLSEVNYDLSRITRPEIEDYKTNILNYRDVWRASLDPMGIVLNRYGDGMEVDFFMTPIPSFADRGISQLKGLFEGTTKDSLSFLTNPHIRMGLLSFVMGFDPKKLGQKISANEEIGKEFSYFSSEVLDGKDIFDYLGGEGAFSLGNFPSDILDGWNIEKIDAYLSIQVTTEEKGKELIEILRKKIMKEMGDSRASGLGDIQSFLAKPLIEDYGGKKIYYFEAIPVPFIGKIGFAYTFVDDFFLLAPNRNTIHRIIDTASKGDQKKEALTDKDTAQKGSFFLTLFDGGSASDDLRGVYEKNKSSVSRYISMFDDNNYGSDSITPLASKYYVSSLKNQRLQKDSVAFAYTLGGLHVKNQENALRISLDEKSHTNLTGATLQMWQNLRSDEKFSKEILSEKGISLEDFMNDKKKSDILALEAIIHLDNAFASGDSLLRNTTFSLSMGENEIGFNLRVFRQKGTIPSIAISSPSQSKDIWVILGVALFLFVISGGVVFLLKRKKSSLPIPLTVAPLDTIGDKLIVNPGVVMTVPNSDPIIVSVPNSPSGILDPMAVPGAIPGQVIPSQENISLPTVQNNLSETYTPDVQVDPKTGNP